MNAAYSSSRICLAAGACSDGPPGSLRPARRRWRPRGRTWRVHVRGFPLGACCSRQGAELGLAALLPTAP
jgi:hypothetical protein